MLTSVVLDFIAEWASENWRVEDDEQGVSIFGPGAALSPDCTIRLTDDEENITADFDDVTAHVEINAYQGYGILWTAQLSNAPIVLIQSTIQTAMNLAFDRRSR